MKLRIFQSEKGDCLLLESADGRLILCDGGMAASMRKVVRAELAKLRASNKPLDAIYVSHIDQDHISGVLALLEDELAWRVHDHHKKNGDTDVKPPKVPRPPEIKAIWHNSFSAQLDDLSGPVADLLAAAAPALFQTRMPELMAVGEALYDIATSIPEAIQVSHLAGDKLLGIPLNQLPGQDGPAKLLMLRPENKAFKIGSMKLTIIGPREEDLKTLKKDWEKWLKANRQKVRDIEKKMKEKMEEIGADSLATAAIDLAEWSGIPETKGVTAPNLASLMFMVEEKGKRLLLTGDSAGKEIFDGLTETGFLKNGHLHVDVHKVQHHGAKANLEKEFARVISADHYVFCGNGLHDNPEETVIRTIFNARCGPANLRALAPAAKDRKFTMWFSTTGDGKADAHMRKVQKLVKELAAQSGGQMKFVFNEGAFTTLSI